MSITALSLFKAHLNLGPDDIADDAYLGHLLDVAEDWIGGHLGTSFGGADVSYPSVTQAALMLGAHLFANREATLIGVSGSAIPFGVYELLAPYRDQVTGHVPF